MASSNLEKLLGVSMQAEDADLIATMGGDILDPGSKVVSVLSARSGRVDLF